MNVSSPASADSLIAVAAYTSKRFWASVDGNIYNFIGSVDPFQICPFSAHGPRRDGVAKPDIAAPGSAVGSVLSGDSAPPWPLPLIAPDGVHLILQGTSMSSPHVTGAVAMLLQKYPTLSPKGMKLLLASGARSDTTTGAVPNPVWGAGKLNLESLLCSDVQAPALANGFPLAGDALYKGTTVGLNWTASDDRLVESIDLAYRIGFLGSFTTIANGEQNDSYYEWTVPNILTDSLQIRVIARDCVSSVTSLGPFVPVRAPSTDVGGDLPVAFATYHPRPNPFTQSSAIRFDVPTSAKSGWPVEVSIHNVAGRLVRTIVKGELPPGRYSFDWNGRDESGAQMGAGIYFLSINAGPNQARDRLIYLR